MGPAIVAKAMEDRRLPITDRLVMWFLSRHLLDWHEFREVRITYLAPALRIEDRSAGRAVRQLVRSGYLEIETRSRRLRAYRLAPLALEEQSPSAAPCLTAFGDAHRSLGATIPRAVEQALDDRALRPSQRIAMWYLARYFLVHNDFRPVKLVALGSTMAVREQTAGQALRVLSSAGYVDVRHREDLRARVYRLPWTRRTALETP